MTIKIVDSDMEAYAFSDNIIDMLGLGEQYKNTEIPNIEMIGTGLFDLALVKSLNVHLDCLNSNFNVLDGRRSTLLTSVGIDNTALGSIRTIKFDNPEYKLMKNGTIDEFKVKLMDSNNNLIQNNNLPISIVLHIK